MDKNDTFRFWAFFFLLSGEEGYVARQNTASGSDGRSSMNSPPFMEPAGSLLCSEEPTTGTVPVLRTNIREYT
jgi:hypothetical protein